MQPPYQPSMNPPRRERSYADRQTDPLPPQTEQTIGDLLVAKASAGRGTLALAGDTGGKNADPVPNFQYHHQPFNYFDMAPALRRAEHLGMGGSAARVHQGHRQRILPQVAFYKPQGNLNEHPGYTDVMDGDRHIVDLVGHLQKSPQWAHMVVVITYDENGGFWDHVAPPKGDRWGPGTRIPALIVSPFAKKGLVDHTLYDTTSILSLITRRFALPTLPGLVRRNAAVAANGNPPLGDLTNALDLTRP
jgi:phospholipase C